MQNKDREIKMVNLLLRVMQTIMLINNLKIKILFN